MIGTLTRHQPTPAPAGVDGSGGPIVAMHDVVKTFETAAGSFPALRGVSLEVEPGEFVAITGRSGSGKSTLLNMLTGIDRPTSGEVVACGAALHAMSENALAVWRGRHLGVIFQFFQLLPTLTVLENVMLPMDFARMYPARERAGRALALLAQVDLAEHARKLPSGLSGGQQQRAAIARALANDPPLLVADEPTGNLDSATAESVFQLFERLVADGKTILMVTHDTDLARRTGRQVVMLDGQVVAGAGARAEAPVLIGAGG
jgi:putative ABC transport system ATP-binding protein